AGGSVGFIMRFAGTDRTKTIAPLVAPTAGLQGTPLTSSRISLGGSLASLGVTGITLDVDNALTPNVQLDGTNRPSEQNADLMTAVLTIRMNAQSGIDPPGFDMADVPAYTEVAGATINILRNNSASPHTL